MTGIKIDYSTSPASIDWGSGVSGIERLTQNAAVNFVTQAGSDVVLSSRGSGLRDDIRSGFVYDTLSAQHAINYAVLDTLGTMRSFERSSDPVEALDSIKATMAGSDNWRMVIDITVTNKNGDRINILHTL